MTIREFRQTAVHDLTEIYGLQEAGNLTYLLLEWITGYSKTSLALNLEMELGEAESSILLEKIAELKQNKPVQYITGSAWFYGIEFKVNEQVLIPRPETEELVHWIHEDNKENAGSRILDIGPGSGCIAISLGKILKDPFITAIDLSPGALAIAIRNAVAHNTGIEFILMDVLDREKWKELGNLDIIISNPPYVRLSEKQAMKPNVLDYEPHLALFVKDEDPLLYYRAICGLAREKLNSNGSVYLEVNEKLGAEVVALFHENGFKDVELRKDMHGKDRMVKAFTLR